MVILGLAATMISDTGLANLRCWGLMAQFGEETCVCGSLEGQWLG